MLGDQFVGGGRIDDHQRAAHAEFGRRRRGHPQIFAKLDAEGEQPAVENQIPADRDGLPAERHAFRRGMPRLEPALLVEFAAARQMRFRHNAENAPTADGDGAVIQPSADFKRQTDDKRRAHGRLQQRVQRLQTTGKQRRMNQQIGARVACTDKALETRRAGRFARLPDAAARRFRGRWPADRPDGRAARRTSRGSCRKYET